MLYISFNIYFRKIIRIVSSFTKITISGFELQSHDISYQIHQQCQRPTQGNYWVHPFVTRNTLLCDWAFVPSGLLKKTWSPDITSLFSTLQHNLEHLLRWYHLSVNITLAIDTKYFITSLIQQLKTYIWMEYVNEQWDPNKTHIHYGKPHMDLAIKAY